MDKAQFYKMHNIPRDNFYDFMFKYSKCCGLSLSALYKMRYIKTMKLKAKFNNDEILLATILGAMDKINLENSLENKDLNFKENVYTIIEDFCVRFGDMVNSSVVAFCHSVPDIEDVPDHYISDLFVSDEFDDRPTLGADIL